MKSEPKKSKGFLRGGFPLLLAFILPACAAVEEAAKEAVRQSALRVDQDQIAELLGLSAAQGMEVGLLLSQYSRAITPGVGGPAGLRGAPGFRPLAATDCVSRIPPGGVDLFLGDRTVIEDYSGCTDRQGQIKYNSKVDLVSGSLKIKITFTGYSQGASNTTYYTYRNGESVWAFFPTPSGLALYIKNQINIRINKSTPGGLRLLDLQFNDLWVYTLDFEKGELIVNATSTLKDLETFTSFILDLQEVTFHDPSAPGTDCPTNPVAGRASLSSGKESVTIEVIGCAQGKITDKDGKSRDVGKKELDEVFEKAADGFIKMFNSIEEGGIEEKVEKVGNVQEFPCAEDPDDAQSIDPNLPPDLKDLLGVWCTAWVNTDASGAYLWDQAGFLDCVKICLAAPGKFAGVHYGGIATTVMGPNHNFDHFFTDPSLNWIINDYVPLCREPVPFQYYALTPIAYSFTFSQFYLTPITTPEEVFTALPSTTSSIPLLLDFPDPPPHGKAFLWEGSYDAAGNPDFENAFLLNFVKKEPGFFELRVCTDQDYSFSSQAAK